MSKKVFVGLSGGVDSSVAALRLKKAGYDVTGVFIKVWQPDFLDCNWEQERLDAMRVAAKLRIPFLTCDAETDYKREVADYFISEYIAGRTPNPDVMCNQHVKFGSFLRFAQEHAADYIATGHYARKSITEPAQLLRGVDTNKDQTYFLWTLPQKTLQRVLFPVGDTPKEEIRREAESAGLLTAEKADSQGICFLGHVDIPEFIAHFTELIPGNVLDTHGNIIGEHRGALVYTVGQRHGFTINKNTEDEVPHYVTERDINANTITVDVRAPSVSTENVIRIENCNWISELANTDHVEAQFRYRQKPFKVELTIRDQNTATLKVLDTVDKPAIGQSCVLYRDERCLGGGIIAA